MKILVMGAGIAGVSAAYVLASRGHTVEVIEKEPAAAMQTSYANGGQLSYSHAEPWANPGALPKVLKWMFKDDAPLVLRPRLDLAMIRWGLQFLTHCTQSKANVGTEVMLRLGLYSHEKLTAIRRETGIDFDFLSKGILHLFSHEKELAAALHQNRFQAHLGSEDEVLTPEECLRKEPALAGTVKKIVGGLYAPDDESGDVHLFCQRLAAYCAEQFGTVFHYSTTINRLETEGESLSRVVTDHGILRAEAYVMALGSWGVPLLRRVGIRVPIYPMKGYSITAPAWEGAPEISLTDDENKVVVSRLGERIRAAGTAEFAGYDTTVRDKRIAPIVRCLHRLFPAADTPEIMDHLQSWACIRPQTPDGPPLIGRTKHGNLFLHTGHGTLGWTQCAGSAHLLADIMEDRPPEISLNGLDAMR